MQLGGDEDVTSEQQTAYVGLLNTAHHMQKEMFNPKKSINLYFIFVRMLVHFVQKCLFACLEQKVKPVKSVYNQQYFYILGRENIVFCP